MRRARTLRRCRPRRPGDESDDFLAFVGAPHRCGSETAATALLAVKDFRFVVCEQQRFECLELRIVHQQPVGFRVVTVLSQLDSRSLLRLGTAAIGVRHLDGLPVQVIRREVRSEIRPMPVDRSAYCMSPGEEQPAPESRRP